MNTDFARQQMIEQQIRAWDVFDTNVLDGLREMRRELFVPAEFEALAFADAGFPLGHGEVMMTPTFEGRVLQALALTGRENVLEIGTGSGFLTACLARLSTHVTSIDIHDDFLDAARQRLDDCDIENVHLLRMNAMRELPEGTFDAIAVTGSIQTLDPRFANALAPGGRLFVIVGDSPAMAATRVTRIDEDKLQNDTMFEIDLAPLTNGALLPQFSF